MSWLDRILSVLLPAPPEIAPGEDVVFVDVRTRAEWNRGHVAGAKLVPHDQVGGRWKELREHRKKRILVYCRTGSRSGSPRRCSGRRGSIGSRTQAGSAGSGEPGW
jgi:rhodanese-related sulfurtransferase